MYLVESQSVCFLLGVLTHIPIEDHKTWHNRCHHHLLAQHGTCKKRPINVKAYLSKGIRLYIDQDVNFVPDNPGNVRRNTSVAAKGSARFV